MRLIPISAALVFLFAGIALIGASCGDDDDDDNDDEADDDTEERTLDLVTQECVTEMTRLLGSDGCAQAGTYNDEDIDGWCAQAAAEVEGDSCLETAFSGYSECIAAIDCEEIVDSYGAWTQCTLDYNEDKLACP